MAEDASMAFEKHLEKFIKYDPKPGPKLGYKLMDSKQRDIFKDGFRGFGVAAK